MAALIYILYSTHKSTLLHFLYVMSSLNNIETSEKHN